MIEQHWYLRLALTNPHGPVEVAVRRSEKIVKVLVESCQYPETSNLRYERKAQQAAGSQEVVAEVEWQAHRVQAGVRVGEW